LLEMAAEHILHMQKALSQMEQHSREPATVVSCLAQLPLRD
jgi:hypothetical protein